MYKKLIVLSLCCSTMVFAEQNSGNLTVKPFSPIGWKFSGADLYVNEKVYRDIGIDGITIPILVNDKIRLQVYTYEGHYPMDGSCQNIKIQSGTNHQVGFVLDNDWRIHCYYQHESQIRNSQ